MVKIIQNYALHDQIGEGQYGKVYKAIDTRTQNQIAVKVINVKKFKDYPKLEECTLNQIEVLSKINSPHIVRFIEILKTANNFYFFYEFCNEGTLEDYIKQNGPLPQIQIIEYLQQILQAFKILNGSNIMHRDLKPSNILLNNGKIKLADFGFCKSLQNSRDLAQTMLGSPIYMAPQVLKGQIYTIKADIWSLGVVIYQMAYGYCPFQESSIARLINLLDAQEVYFNSDINQLSSNLRELMRKMLVKDHFKRISWDQIFEYYFQGGTINKNRPDYSKNNWQKSPLNQRTIQNIQNSQSSFKKPVYQQESMFKKKVQKQNNTDPKVDKGFYKLHDKIAYYIKIISDLFQENICLELCLHLVPKLYQIILKEHYKLPNTKEYTNERIQINKMIKIFEKQGQNVSIDSIGPLLTQYIKQLQSGRYGEVTRRRLLICISLLDMNEISNQEQICDNSHLSIQKLSKEINQKLIRNII